MTSSELRPQLPTAAASALRQGNKIEAIRLVRAELRIGLKAAKDLVDASDITPSVSADTTGSGLWTGKPSGPGIWLWLIVIALAVGAWYGWT